MLTFFSFRVKMAEESFKQARQKTSYNVTTKNATGIVCSSSFCRSACHLFFIPAAPASFLSFHDAERFFT